MNTNIYSTLHEGNLLEAFNMLKTKIDSLGDWQLQEDLATAKQTYTTMLNYMSQGVEDPKSGQIRNDIIRQAYSLNDRANLTIRQRKSPTDKYCTTQKQCASESFSIDEIQTALETIDRMLASTKTNTSKQSAKQEDERQLLIQQHDTLMLRIFNHTWTSVLWTTSTYTQYADFIANTNIPVADRALTISSVTLAAYELFDPQKIMLLMDSYLATEPDISQRALAGMILLIIRYDKRLRHYTAITSRFGLYIENKQFVHDCFLALITLQYSKMTDTVSAKMANDIMPAILKSQRFKRSSIIELDAELSKNGENPEWLRDTQNDTKAEQKIRQMSEMQMEGADVYLNSFRHLKNFSFFNQLHHWLSIFSFNYPDMQPIVRQLKPETLNIVTLLLQNAPFCDSDKFSFLCMMGNIPQSGHEAIASQIKDQMEDADMDDILKKNQTRQRSAKGTLRAYVADLYRVFKVYPFHTQMFDPFNKQLNNFSPLYTQTLRPLLEHYDETMELAEFMMRKGLYDDAIKLFEYLNPKEREQDANLWQKIGFCQQKMGKNAEALTSYLKAHNLQPQSVWTIQHAAQTAFDTHNFDTALGFIETILESDPDNVKWLGRKIECLFAKGEYETSLPTLYKIAYIDEESERTKEMLAWGLLMTRQTEKAYKIYNELHDIHASVKNIIGLAHMLVIKNEMQEALRLYKKAYELAESEGEFHHHFWNLHEYFTHMGLDNDKMQLIYDAARI